MHKIINGKQFELGSLYVAPWRLTTRPMYTSPWEPEVAIPDGSLVVLLDIGENNSNARFSDYKLQLLTIEGEIVDIYCTTAGLDYWKTVEQTKKNKKF